MAIAAIEDGDWQTLTDHIYDRYKDDRGRDKKKLQQLAFLTFRRGPIKILVTSKDIAVAIETGYLKCTIYAIQGSQALETPRDLLPKKARMYTLEIKWIWNGDAWVVARITEL